MPDDVGIPIALDGANRQSVRRQLRTAWLIVCSLVCALLGVAWIESWGTTHRTHQLTDIGWRSNSGVLTICAPVSLIDDHPQQTHVAESIVFHSPRGPITLSWNFSFLGLRFFGPGSVWILEVPYWLPVATTIVLAAAPFLRLRFGLRTLLVAIALVAMLLGLAVYAPRN